MAENQNNSENEQGERDFFISLEDNAFGSLEHGVEHFLGGSKRDLKFTVLHIFHAVELLLKARLAKEHPLLILQRPEDDREHGHTVDYFVMLKRLKNLGVKFSREEMKSLDFLHGVRNKIEHRELADNRIQIEDYIARAVKLLDRFVSQELGIRLKDRIEVRLYKEMLQVMYSYEERQQIIQGEIHDALPGRPKEQLDYVLMACENCEEEAVLVPDPTSEDNSVHCFACETRFDYFTCDNCGTPVLLSSPSDEREDDICDACWNSLMSGD